MVQTLPEVVAGWSATEAATFSRKRSTVDGCAAIGELRVAGREKHPPVCRNLLTSRARQAMNVE
jgi:hypothetical protein